MLKIRTVFFVLGMLLSSMVYAAVQVSIQINVPVYPELVVVPGYPVYYAPRLEANFFFYDGMYWVYQDDDWYESSWYNGPWWLVEPEVVPVFILRVPVRYYRQPPAYFYGWRSDAPPRWGDHWGRDWEQRRGDWDRWDRSAAPAPAPLPVYQREYSGDRYPRQVEQQHELQKQKYRYEPRDPVVRQQYQEQAVQRGPAQQEKQGAREDRGFRQQNSPAVPRSQPPQKSGPEVQDRRQPPQPERGQHEQAVQITPAQQVKPQHENQVAPEDRSFRQQNGPPSPRAQFPQRENRDVQRPPPYFPQAGRPEAQDRRQLPQPGATQHEQQMQKSQGREEREGRKQKQELHEQKPGQGQEQERHNE